MKPLRWVLIIGLIAVLPLAIYSQEGGEEVKVTKVFGSVSSQFPGEQQWQPLAAEKTLGLDYLVRTADDSYVELEVSPGNQFRLKENSQLAVKELGTAQGAVKLTRFDLLDGEVLAKLDNLPLGTLIEVTSPTAVAGARGTSFGVRYRPKNQLADVSVLQDQVVVTSVGEPNKQQIVNSFQRVTIAPWEMATIQVRGTGVLSEKILGKVAIEKAKNPGMEATGVGITAEEAKDNACVKLARMVLNIKLDAETSIEDLLNRNPALCLPLYSYIAQAKVTATETLADQQVQVMAKLELFPISDIIKRPLPSLPVIVKLISLEEYGQQFGALARLTTQRAATLAGYRKLAEAMYGAVISSKTTLQDYVAQNDRITSVVEGIVKGAEIIETRYYSDGSMSVVMTIRADLIRSEVAKVTGDIFGTKYFTSPAIISIDDYLGGEW